MYNSIDFLDMLNSGKDPSTIASELTKALNDAISQKAEMDKKNIAQRKVSALADLIDDVKEYLYEFYPKVGSMVASLGLDSEELAEYVVNGFDEAYADMEKDFEALDHLLKMFEASEQPKTAKNEEIDPIADFLKKNKLS